ncbi:MAG TPA: universal stress protein [Frateuria sp.]|uniref:universal stress protein n=1 Tax=Frateuria sp. TaxID=2211372 RepID=UPI002D80F862|nr:universal stress protein [Frateuria sp.]HET6805526.1 universal stress protein [Frateuria sp.]
MYDILVNSLNYENWSRGAQYGTQLAALLQASITGAYIYPSTLYATPSFSTPELIEAVLETARTLEASALAAERPFVEWAESLGIEHAAWVVGQGNLSDALVQIACWHDLLVLERDPVRTWASPSDLAALILSIGLPCIVVPPQPVQTVALSRVAIAWNGAPEAIRAVHSALPLLQRAGEVVLLRGAPKEVFQEISWKPPFDIDAYLNRHGIRARSQDLPTNDHDAGEALLEHADRFHADLLVMGAYGRSRFSEWALGGATRHVLWHARLPVLFRH